DDNRKLIPLQYLIILLSDNYNQTANRLYKVIFSKLFITMLNNNLHSVVYFFCKLGNQNCQLKIG
ncbi:MAG TPA: hypothetical protein VF465_10860, partial [Flavobacterium sp.]|uniref:hypothetical protein n=1 Tax=Flavobacterium sp. TaxID=239 RepID=UPI002ED60143